MIEMIIDRLFHLVGSSVLQACCKLLVFVFYFSVALVEEDQYWHEIQSHEQRFDYF